jgi:hypothetical protein
MLALPPMAPATGWRSSTRLARDHYVRLDSNDYSVHPTVIGRRIEVVAVLDRVKVYCEGRVVADHQRVWAWHQTLTDPDHIVGSSGGLILPVLAVPGNPAEPGLFEPGLAIFADGFTLSLVFVVSG